MGRGVSITRTCRSASVAGGRAAPLVHVPFFTTNAEYTRKGEWLRVPCDAAGPARPFSSPLRPAPPWSDAPCPPSLPKGSLPCPGVRPPKPGPLLTQCFFLLLLLKDYRPTTVCRMVSVLLSPSLLSSQVQPSVPKSEDSPTLATALQVRNRFLEEAHRHDRHCELPGRAWSAPRRPSHEPHHIAALVKGPGRGFP